jgi:cyclic pyranopterin phosphate synthase
MIEVYTDGACLGNPGPGGWAALVVDGGKRLVFEGREEKTTNNRMELRAAIEGLARTAAGSEVVLYSDSQYLVYTMTRNWKRKANLDLWQKLDALCRERHVKWEWRPGEEGPDLAEAHRRADGMAGIKADQPVRMVDVGGKPVTRREAVARALVKLSPQTLALLQKGGLPKGDPLAASQVAGILAAKEVPRLIPLCHPLPIDEVKVDLRLDSSSGAVEITASVLGEARTGYEMEALTAAAVAALTIYDMVKAQDPGPTIEIRLVSKSGGKSGTVVLPQEFRPPS